MDQRCDGNMDCSDKSDEVNCQKIEIHESHLKDSPPPSSNGEFRLPLHTRIDIVNLLNMDEVESKLTIQIKLIVEWIDNRLEFIDLKSIQSKNFLTPNEVDSIWIPTLLFSNTKDKQMADFRTKSTFASVGIRNGSYGKVRPYSDIKNGYTYTGKDW